MKKAKNLNNIIIFAAVLLLVGSVAYAYSVSQNINVAGDYYYYEAEGQPAPGDISLGAVSGPDIYNDVNVYGSLTYGSSDYVATSTSGQSFTLTFKDLNNYTYIDVMNNKETLTYTLPATSTMMNILPEVGSTRTWFFHNATSTAGKTLTLSAGAGMDLVSASTTAETLDAGDWAKLTCTQIYYRAADNQNIMCNVEKLVDAD